MQSISNYGWTAHHNSDFSGAVIFRKGEYVVEIPGGLILDLVGEYVRAARISDVERMTTKELLK